MNIQPRPVRAALLCALLALMPALAHADGQIVMKNFSYSPMELSVAAGSTVTWKNLDGEPHTVVSLDGQFRSQALDENDTFSFKFDKPGTYKYICSIHPQMKGTITVK
ncbi:MAG TPA: cupredoxin family copper-binding protein [Rhizomicrobium sp.]|jgi:plastocyanin